MRNSIRGRLILAFIGLAVGPLLLVGIILAWQSFSSLQEQALNLQQEAAKRVNSQVVAFFQELENELRFTVQTQGLDNRSLSELLAYQPAFDELHLLNSQGQEQASVYRTGLASAVPVDRSQSDEFVIPKTTGQVYYGSVRYDQSANEPLMTIALPVVNLRTGSIDGVLVSVARIKKVWDLISSIKVSEGQSVYILDAQGHVVAHRNPSVVLRGVTFHPRNDSIIQPGLASADPALAVNATGDFTLKKLVSGPDVVLAENPLQLGHQEFSVVAEQAVSEALSLAIDTAFLIAGLILASLVFSITLGLRTVRQIVQPIQSMATVAQAISAGDLSQQVKVNSQDELGVLGNAFNQMTTQLRQILEGLEQRVAERTQDLTLAAEVGRSVSHVRELNTLLSNAVDLIHERFELYYAQVYLPDAPQRHLILRAGTGSVGRTLLQQGHHLPIGPGSINGLAAAEKRVVIVSDTTLSDTFHPNPLLPDTRSEMAVPLTVGDHVVGVLDLQSARPGALTAEHLSAFEALAGQLAIAIENAALFAETEQARAQVEAQARRLTQSGWHEFLDAIHRSELLGYTFDQQTLVPLTQPLPVTSSPTVLETPILLLGEPIGCIQLEREDQLEQPWDSAEVDLVSNIAQRVAAQVENLRLLAQAEQYRVEAESAIHRLTREGWEALQLRSKLAPGYVYDHSEVKPFPEKSVAVVPGTLKQPLVVRNEPIGELAVEVETNFAEVTEIITAVAEQLSGHLETLRLSEVDERRAQRERALRQITSALRSSTNPTTIMRIAVRELGSVLGRKAVIQMTAPEQVNPAESVQDREDPTGSSAGQS